MKKEYGLALLALFFLSLNAITGVYAFEDKQQVQKNNPLLQTVLKENRDVTGDGINDTIKIYGTRYDKSISNLKEMILLVTASNGQTYRSKFKGGLNTKIKFIDLNQDQIKDIIITTKNDRIDNYDKNTVIYSVINSKLTEILKPDDLTIKSRFKKNYKAQIEIDGKTYIFDLKNRKKEYDQLGLYFRGNLNEPRELIVNPFSELEPIMIRDKFFGLQGKQKIYGADETDEIVYINTVWSYKKDKWNLVQMNFQK